MSAYAAGKKLIRTSHAFKPPPRVTRATNGLRVAVIVPAAILMLLCLYFNASAQNSQMAQTAHKSQDERVRQIIESLEEDNTVRIALERGYRGDGVYYEWMGKMRQLGVKQVSFTIRFNYRDESKKLK